MVDHSETISAAARVVVRAIRRDAVAGEFEGATTVADLATLHDYVDANEYLLEVAEDLGASSAFEPFGEEWFEWVGRVEDAVDAILGAEPVVVG